jgi:toxin YoeB
MMKREPPPKQRLAIFQPEFIEDLAFWVETDRKVSLKTLRFVNQILREPFKGLGKPEPLKYLGPGVWSRRITQEHRLVSLVEEDRIHFLQCRYHY